MGILTGREFRSCRLRWGLLRRGVEFHRAGLSGMFGQHAKNQTQRQRHRRGEMGVRRTQEAIPHDDLRDVWKARLLALLKSASWSRLQPAFRSLRQGAMNKFA